jgi:hypothetical protein
MYHCDSWSITKRGHSASSSRRSCSSLRAFMRSSNEARSICARQGARCRRALAGRRYGMGSRGAVSTDKRARSWLETRAPGEETWRMQTTQGFDKGRDQGIRSMRKSAGLCTRLCVLLLACVVVRRLLDQTTDRALAPPLVHARLASSNHVHIHRGSAKIHRGARLRRLASLDAGDAPRRHLLPRGGGNCGSLFELTWCGRLR